MKKTDVEFHSDRFREGHAAVNVKVYKSPDVATWKKSNEADARFTDEWLEQHVSEERRGEWWNDACEIAWEYVDGDAANVFGHGYHVHSEGRSGGWAVVCHGLGGRDHFAQFPREAVASWDAIALSRWAQFAKFARQDADDVPYLYVDLIYHNVFTEWAERTDAIAERLAYYVGSSA